MSRKIKPEELKLLGYLVKQADFKAGMPQMVEEYGEYEMGSITLGGDPLSYAGDIIQAEFTDADGVDVVITLTKDTNDQLLDLDFWKMDFSKLVSYPYPSVLTLKK